MSKKQDRGRVRTAHDLEQKYKFGNQEKLMKEMQKAISEAKQSISDMQKDNNSTDVQKDNNSTDVFSTIVSVFLEPGQEELDTVNAHQSGEKPLSEKEIPLYDITGDGAVGMLDLLAITKAENGDSTLANWDKAVKSEVTITINLSSPENLIKATGTNMWGRDVEYNTGDFIGWVLKDIEANKKKIESLREDVDSLESDTGSEELQGRVEALEESVGEVNVVTMSNRFDTIYPKVVVNASNIEDLQARVDSLESDTGSEELQGRVEALEESVGEVNVVTMSNRFDTIYPKVVVNASNIEDLQARVDSLESDTGNSGADYIVDCGTSGIWTYEKWNSGKVVCWGTYKTSFAIENAWSSGVNYSGSLSQNFPSSLFNDVPAYVSVKPYGYSGFPYIAIVDTLTKAKVGWVCWGFGFSGSINRDSFFIEAIGKWK